MTDTTKRVTSSASSQRVLADHAAEQRDAYVALAADELRSTHPDKATVDRFLTDADRWAARATNHDARAAVITEPLTYRQGGEHSYFADLARANSNPGMSPNSAVGKRLERHAQEMAVEMPRYEARQKLPSTGPEGVRFEKRVNPGRTPGQGGNAAPPLWVIDQFATAPRPRRILSDLSVGYLLPGGVSSVSVPRLTTGTTATVARDGAAVANADLTDAFASSPVVPLVGSVDTPLQLLEQSPRDASFDQVVFRDISASYDAQLEAMLVNGSGVNGQFLGLLNVPSGAGLANAVTYTDATPTGVRMWPMFGQAAARVGNNRLMPPEVWLMRTARWGWLGGSEDGQGLPISLPEAPERPSGTDGPGPKGVTSILGWPVYLNDAIPATLGAVASPQDAVIACRPSDVSLWESRPRLRIDFQTLSGTMQVRIVVQGSAAALVARYPTGIAAITGTGTIVQPGYGS